MEDERAEALEVLLEQWLTNEALRHMCRKGGIASVQNGKLALFPYARAVTFRMLHNSIDVCVQLMNAKRTRTLTKDIVEEALTKLKAPLPKWSREEFGKCKAFSGIGSRGHGTNARGYERIMPGEKATKEIEFEQKHNHDCVYTDQAPFVRLTKKVFTAYTSRGVKSTPQAVNVLQFVIESLLVTLFHYTAFLLWSLSKGHSQHDAKGRIVCNSRDFMATVHILRGDVAAGGDAFDKVPFDYKAKESEGDIMPKEWRQAMPFSWKSVDSTNKCWPILQGEIALGGMAEGDDDGSGGRGRRSRATSRGRGTSARGSSGRGRGRGTSGDRGRGYTQARGTSDARARGRGASAQARGRGRTAEGRASSAKAKAKASTRAVTKPKAKTKQTARRPHIADDDTESLGDE